MGVGIGTPGRPAQYSTPVFGGADGRGVEGTSGERERGASSPAIELDMTEIGPLMTSDEGENSEGLATVEGGSSDMGTADAGARSRVDTGAAMETGSATEAGPATAAGAATDSASTERTELGASAAAEDGGAGGAACGAATEAGAGAIARSDPRAAGTSESTDRTLGRDAGGGAMRGNATSLRRSSGTSRSASRRALSSVESTSV